MRFINSLHIVLFSLLCLISTLAGASKPKVGEQGDATNFFHDSFLGEQKSPLYYGPNSAEQVRDEYDNGLKFKDQQFLDQYWNRLIPAVPYSLEVLLEKKLEDGQCPNEVLGHHMEYIRYIFRLITISYLYEELKFLKRFYYGIGGGMVSCSNNVEALFKRCDQKHISLEMRKFLQRSSRALAHEKMNYVLRRFKKKEIAGLLQKSGRHQFDQGGSFTKVMEWHCRKSGGCYNLTIEEMKKAVEQRCLDDRRLLGDICREVDQIYGLAGNRDVILLLADSNIKNLFLSREQFVACLKRYQKIFASRERSYPVLNNLFPIVRMELDRFNGANKRGVLFLPGALKEFDDQGLKSFIYRPKPKVVKKKVAKKLPPPPKPKVVVPPPPKKVKPKPKPKPKTKPKLKIKQKPLSAFELAVAIRNKNDLPRYPVDMEKFKTDFSFSDLQRRELEGALHDYYTQKALSQMKEGDGLGERDEPVLLLFVKYLIDSGKHQGLYNIQSVLGKSFFLLNDIDKKEIPVYVELKNDKSTGYEWQLNILPTPEEEDDEGE